MSEIERHTQEPSQFEPYVGRGSGELRRKAEIHRLRASVEGGLAIAGLASVVANFVPGNGVIGTVAAGVFGAKFYNDHRQSVQAANEADVAEHHELQRMNRRADLGPMPGPGNIDQSPQV